MPTQKELTLLHLRRRHRDLADNTPDHVKMASESMDYALRERAVQAAAAAREKHKAEIAALEAAITFIETHADHDMGKGA